MVQVPLGIGPLNNITTLSVSQTLAYTDCRAEFYRKECNFHSALAFLILSSLWPITVRTGSLLFKVNLYTSKQKLSLF